MAKRVLTWLVALCVLLSCAVARAYDAPDVSYPDGLPDAPKAALDAAMAEIGQPYTLEYACGFASVGASDGAITTIHAQIRLTLTGGLHVAILQGWQGVWRLKALSAVLPVRGSWGPVVHHECAWRFFVEYADATFTFAQENNGEWLLESYAVLDDAGAERFRAECMWGAGYLTLVTQNNTLTLEGEYDRAMATVRIAELPLTPRDALTFVNGAACAMVNNPNPEDRLHLRTRPDRTAPSLGKYYTGVVARLLEGGDADWARVSVCGVEGYMMRRYLAFGDELLSVQSAMPKLLAVSFDATPYMNGMTQAQYDALPKDDVDIKASPSDNARVAMRVPAYTDVTVLGVLGDDWAHVRWNGQTGYIRQRQLWPGNG